MYFSLFEAAVIAFASSTSNLHVYICILNHNLPQVLYLIQYNVTLTNNILFHLVTLNAAVRYKYALLYTF